MGGRIVREGLGLVKERSFGELRGKFMESGGLGEIKYLSPHLGRNGNLGSPAQKQEEKGKLKF